MNKYTIRYNSSLNDCKTRKINRLKFNECDKALYPHANDGHVVYLPLPQRPVCHAKRKWIAALKPGCKGD